MDRINRSIKGRHFFSADRNGTEAGTAARKQCDFLPCFLVQKAYPTCSIQQQGLSAGRKSNERGVVVSLPRMFGHVAVNPKIRRLFIGVFLTAFFGLLGFFLLARRSVIAPMERPAPESFSAGRGRLYGSVGRAAVRTLEKPHSRERAKRCGSARV